VSGFTGLRARFHEPGPLFSALMMIPEPAIGSILGWSGLDYVMLDAEHGPYTLASLRACAEAIHATPAAVVVRTASQDAVEIQQLLDLGADGVLVPRIGSAEEAAAVVRAARYPPEGRRGVGGAVRATRYGLDALSYLGGANTSVAALAIIETRCGVANAAEIAAVPGLDGILVGPTDLSADLGVPGVLDHPPVLAAFDTVLDCALAAGLKVGGRAEPRSAAERESTLAYCFTDTLDVAAAAAAAVENARKALA